MFARLSFTYVGQKMISDNRKSSISGIISDKKRVNKGPFSRSKLLRFIFISDKISLIRATA